MKIKITRTDGVVLEAEGTVEELRQLIPAEPPVNHITITTPQPIPYQPIPLPYTPITPWWEIPRPQFIPYEPTITWPTITWTCDASLPATSGYLQTVNGSSN